MKDYVVRAPYFCSECESFDNGDKYVCNRCYNSFCKDHAEEHGCESDEEREYKETYCKCGKLIRNGQRVEEGFKEALGDKLQGLLDNYEEDLEK